MKIFEYSLTYKLQYINYFEKVCFPLKVKQTKKSKQMTAKDFFAKKRKKTKTNFFGKEKRYSATTLHLKVTKILHRCKNF